uniref:LysM domain-containing protein n=1 Tax=Desulfovibrio sp. U5L TaxID=596152 RepID=I2Q1Z8_9BACT
MPLFPPLRSGRARRPGLGVGPGSRSGRGGLAAVLLCLTCLVGAACDRNAPDAPGEAVDIAPSTVFSQRAPALPAETAPASKVLKLLEVGDSLSISLGEQMERALAGAPGIDFVRDGMRSTGLTRPELLDWPARLRELVGRTAPDVVVVMIGANDVMPVDGPEGGRIYFDNPAWAGAYAAKAGELVAICRQANPGVVVYWVGVPAMGDPGLASGVKRVNAALAVMCGKTPGCRFIDTEAAFSDPDGRFSRHARDGATGDTLVLRTADGVHLTDGGARLLAGVVLATVADREKFPPLASVDELRLYARDVRPVADEAPSPPQAPQPPQVKAAPAKAGGSVYSVRKGDTLAIIAKRLGIPSDDLLAVNPGVDSRRLSLGQPLRVPAKR